jgi:hypothetical protein
MWTLKITPINLATKEVSVSATRTDDVDQSVFTTTTTGKVDTAQSKTAILDAIWSDWQRYQTNKTNIATIIGTLEADGAANLEARE